MDLFEEEYTPIPLTVSESPQSRDLRSPFNSTFTFEQICGTTPSYPSSSGQSDSLYSQELRFKEGSSMPKKKGRKGHSKSRTGCFNCKRARIKCKENRPECDYCAHRDLKCTWPDLQINQSGVSSGSLIRRQSGNSNTLCLSSQQQVGRAALSPQPAVPNAYMPPVFTMQDFRLFNYFIQSAYPFHPIGNDRVWKHEIPNISHNYDFLLHSMLALSASELACSREPTSQMNSTALAHRVKAISSLNTAISKGISCYEEGNAMLATCFTLLFQSCLIEDGLTEYMMFIRGTVSVGMQMGMKGMTFLFERIFDPEQLEQVDPLMKKADLIESRVVQAACRSLERMAHLCTASVELEAYRILYGIARALVTSSRDGYMELRKMYELFSWSMSQPDFEYFVSPANEICRILQAHFVALQLIMSPVTKNEWAIKERETGMKDDGNGKTVGWLVGIHNHARRDMLKYYRWTMWVQTEVLSGRLYNGKISDESMPGLLELLG